MFKLTSDCNLAFISATTDSGTLPFRVLANVRTMSYGTLFRMPQKLPFLMSLVMRLPQACGSGLWESEAKKSLGKSRISEVSNC